MVDSNLEYASSHNYVRLAINHVFHLEQRSGDTMSYYEADETPKNIHAIHILYASMKSWL